MKVKMTEIVTSSWIDQQGSNSSFNKVILSTKTDLTEKAHGIDLTSFMFTFLENTILFIFNPDITFNPPLQKISLCILWQNLMNKMNRLPSIKKSPPLLSTVPVHVMSKPLGYIA